MKSADPAKPGSKAAVESAPTRPRAIPVRLDGIPPELRERLQWVAWKFELRMDKKGVGKWTKVPIDPKTGRMAKADDPTTWASFVTAVAYMQAHPDETDGIGFEYSADDPYCGVDLDDAIDPDTGEPKPWAVQIVAELATLTETSPSATGGKLYCRAAKPGDRCRAKYADGEIEMYDRGRFFAVTGARWQGTPPTVEDRQEAVNRLYARVFADKRKEAKQSSPPAGPDFAGTDNGPSPSGFSDDEVVAIIDRAKNGAKFRSLMAGDVSAYDDDDSRADGALCALLAFVTRDSGQIERIFGRSRLADRDKWRDRADYRRRTIDRALELVTEQYKPPRRRRPSANGIHTTNGDASAGEGEAGGGSHRDAHAGTGDLPLGPLTLRPGAAQRTAGGAVKAPVQALLNGEVLYDFVLSSSPSAWRQHIAMLKLQTEDLPDQPAMFKAFAAIVAAAGRRADAPPDPDAATIESIVKALAPPRWNFTARTPKGGAISEARGCEVSRAEFVACVDDELMSACCEAPDAPQDFSGRVSRLDLLRMIQAELQVLWATLMRTLPPLADADAPAGSATGKALREALVRLWTAATTWQIPKKSDNQESERIGATRASLISRVKSQFRQWERVNQVPQAREKWRQIHPAASAWWRVDGIDGEVLVHLGMRWEIVATMKQELPGVTDQDSLLRLGRQFGVLSVTHPVSDRLSGGKARLAVLTLDFTAELMSVPDDKDASEGGQEGYEGTG